PVGGDPGAPRRAAPARLVLADRDRAGRVRDAPDPRLPDLGGDVLRHVRDGPEGPQRRLRVHEHLVLAARRRRALCGDARRRRQRPAVPREGVRVPRRVRHRADGVRQRRVRRPTRRGRLPADRRGRQGGPAGARVQATAAPPDRRRDPGGGRGVMQLLFDGIDEPGLNTLEVYRRERGGYEMLSRALEMDSADILAQLQASGLRGRGGAGFAMGTKASFLPKGDMDKYVVCNADESEPGTFKDRELMQKNPHLLIEGVAIAAHAV